MQLTSLHSSDPVTTVLVPTPSTVEVTSPNLQLGIEQVLHAHRPMEQEITYDDGSGEALRTSQHQTSWVTTHMFDDLSQKRAYLRWW